MAAVLCLAGVLPSLLPVTSSMLHTHAHRRSMRSMPFCITASGNGKPGDDEESIESLQAEIERLRQENAAARSEQEPRTPTDWDAAWLQVVASKPAGGEPPSVEQGLPEADAPPLFRFEPPPSPPRSGQRYVAGLDTDRGSNETLMLNLWSSKRTFQVVVTVLAITLLFYIYVGLSGGITDGFDRYSEPVESLAQTLADPNYEPPLPPGAWTGVDFN